MEINGSINLKIKDIEIEMTIEEAKQLQTYLNNIFINYNYVWGTGTTISYPDVRTNDSFFIKGVDNV